MVWYVKQETETRLRIESISEDIGKGKGKMARKPQFPTERRRCFLDLRDVIRESERSQGRGRGRERKRGARKMKRKGDDRGKNRRKRKKKDLQAYKRKATTRPESGWEIVSLTFFALPFSIHTTYNNHTSF
ncbi:hypothetical protein ASPWEDRAFT_511131 [Aspergillus wentii DTO 134E9]|uniref:Uncharacterized protein n=1 Tax=Aspergillus wentii DTO 134E9 TaxID=1073089 RepID=A0A1L9RKN6_ASPWE|nr:uncharacterized protein ASPWEDRAFT_511131 [Aspergillus wentii DTO 134E9]OJJ35490.1 hypothetical protein ASPWEDRAFT_511131 [Aspergillus wentii DTO 134E9]